MNEPQDNTNEPIVVRIENIECPKCLTVQPAEVTWTEGDLWPVFIHLCVKCNYIIMESEWTKVDEVAK